MSHKILPERTPDQIRDDAMKWFNQVAPAKYNDGQARQEITNNLDKHPDLVEAIGEELTDGIFYLRSLSRQIDELKLQVDQLQKRNKWLEEKLRDARLA
tara:strand:+ start:199 stop:495 length:297 start_codon:yes stop_codon:yes gene_type:complete